MQLIGQAVEHTAFGAGVVTGQEENVVTVTFAGGEKRFLYPDAFQKFLTLKNERATEQVDSLLQEQKQQQTAQLEALLAEQERQQKIHNFKVSVTSQAAFALELEQENPLEVWRVTTGSYLSGSAKGEARIPEKLKPNSLCLLTSRPAGTPEAERQIVGAFMVREDFFGNECGDGVICAHPKYRLALSPEQQLPFWPYFDGKSNPRWGSIAFRYCSNRTMQRVLFDLLERLKGTDQGELAESFYSYFCTQNQLQGPPVKRRA